MLRCKPGRVLLVPHPAAELPFVAGDEEYAYLEDWHARLRHRPAVPFGHFWALVEFGGVGPLLSLAPAAPATAPADLALEAARRARGELVSARRAGHGAIFLPVRSGICLTPARAPLSPAMAARCATPTLLMYDYPPVVHQQQSFLHAYSCHPIQGTAYVMMTAAIVSGLVCAYRETHHDFEPSPCYYSLTGKFSVGDLAPGDGSVADALTEYDAIVRAVPSAAVHDRLPYHHDPKRHAPRTFLPQQVGTVADGRCHYVRVKSVPRSPQAPLGVMLAEPRLADVAPRALPVTTEPWAVPAGFPTSDPDTVPPSADEAAASAAYRARKRRHADMARGSPSQPRFHVPVSQAVASPGADAGPSAFPASQPSAGGPGSQAPGEFEGEPSAGPMAGAASHGAAGGGSADVWGNPSVTVGGATVGRGAAPQLWTAHPRGPSQNIPIRASKGMACPDLGETGFG